MTTTCTENLKHLFDELHRCRDENVNVTDPVLCDQLALLCLKITAALLEDHELARDIAKELSLIVDIKEPIKSGHELFDAITHTEQSLESHLRGFSGLMEWILEDTRVRRAPEATLCEMPTVDPHLAASFCRLIRALNGLLELEEAYILHFPVAATTVFLIMLCEITRDLFAITETDADALIASWFESRIKSESLRRIHVDAMKILDGPLKDHARVGMAPDVVMVVLSFWSADFHMLDSDEATLLNAVLNAMGMEGIEPLIEAGFLELKDCVKDEAITHSGPKLLLAT